MPRVELNDQYGESAGGQRGLNRVAFVNDVFPAVGMTNTIMTALATPTYITHQIRENFSSHFILINPITALIAAQPLVVAASTVANDAANLGAIIDDFIASIGTPNAVNYEFLRVLTPQSPEKLFQFISDGQNPFLSLAMASLTANYTVNVGFSL